MNVNTYSTEMLQAVVDVLEPQDMKIQLLEGLEGRSILFDRAIEVLRKRYTERFSEYDHLGLRKLSSLLREQSLKYQHEQLLENLKKNSNCKSVLAGYYYDFSLSDSTDPCRVGLFPILDTLDQKFEQYACTTLDSNVNNLELEIQTFMDEHPLLMLILVPLLIDVIKDMLKTSMQKMRHILFKKKRLRKLCKQQQAIQIPINTKTHILCDKTGKVYTAASLNSMGSHTIH